jgi:hypothetical protein
LNNLSDTFLDADGNEVSVFEFLANNYQLHGKAPYELCQHNANIAEQAGHAEAAQVRARARLVKDAH